MRVLLVEDDDDLAEVLASALVDLGFEVARVADGEEGLYRAAEWPWDAIILDLMLPGLEGMEVLRRLRATSSVPVLVLTARDSLADRVRGLDKGADDYVVKPVALPELAARLRALIRRASEAKGDRVRIGDLTVDFRRRRVDRGGEPLVLTRSEWTILLALLTHPGEPVSSSELGDRLTHGDERVRANTVAVHVRNLRGKVGDGRIVTRRGFGYLVREDDGDDP